MPSNRPPVMAPQTTLPMGDAVMGQVPLAQPTNFQYKNPPTPPNRVPSRVSPYFFNNLVSLAVVVCYMNKLTLAFSARSM